MNWLKVLLIFQVLFFSTYAVAQNKQIEKANKRYQIKKYAEAIPLYEEGLAKNKSLSAQTRLAYCYRMNNNVEKATNLYAEIVQNKRARPITWYYYGESLIGQGKYEEAKVWLRRYTDVKPNDKKGHQLLSSIEQVQNIEPFFQTGYVMPFVHNSSSDDSAPIFFNDGIAFSSDRKTGLKVMKKKSSWTGRDFLSLYFSKKKSDGTYGEPSPLSRRLNDMNKNTGTISIAPDGTYAVFSRNSDVSNSKNVYNLMLYRADITSEGKFKNVQMLSFCSKNVNYMHPTFSPDGNTLYFTSDKRGEGGTDIFYVTKDGDDDWSRPKNLGTPVNTEANEGFPFMSFDGRLYFCSKGHVSYGGFDILMTKKNQDGTWTTPVNVGEPINSPADDISIYISPDGRSGMFASSRNGSDDDIYMFDIKGYNESYPSSGFNDMPLTNAPSMPSSEMATMDQPSENKMEEEKSTLPFEPIEPYAKKEKTNPQPTERWSTIPQDPTKPFEASVPVGEEEEDETIVVDYPSNNEMEVKEKETSLPFEPIDAYDKKEESVNSTVSETIEVASTNAPSTQPSEDVFEIKMETVQALEEDSKKFKEGLATTEDTMTDEVTTTSTSETKVDRGIIEIKDYLSGESLDDEAIFVLENVKFAPRNYSVQSDFTNDLTELIRLLNANPKLKIEVAAHTESIGDDKENMVLSIKRATAIAGFLIRNKIATDRVKVMGYGETLLLNHCSNGVRCSNEEHALNQRIEVRILN